MRSDEDRQAFKQRQYETMDAWDKRVQSWPLRTRQHYRGFQSLAFGAFCFWWGLPAMYQDLFGKTRIDAWLNAGGGKTVLTAASVSIPLIFWWIGFRWEGKKESVEHASSVKGRVVDR